MACSRNSYDPDCPTQHIALLLLDKQGFYCQYPNWQVGNTRDTMGILVFLVIIYCTGGANPPLMCTRRASQRSRLGDRCPCQIHNVS